MVEIGTIKSKPATVTVPIGDESFTLVYAPSKINADVERVELEYRRRGETMSALAYCLSEWIVEWDLTEDGQPYEITMENVVALGADVVNVISEALLRHRAGGGGQSTDEADASD